MEDLFSYSEFVGKLTVQEIVLLATFASIMLVRFCFDLFVYGRVVFAKDKRIKNSKPSFSVLMVIRNEENNLKNNLPALLNTKYLTNEVIVVDDFSQDSSYATLGLIREKHKTLQISNLSQEMRYSSKQALNIGLKAAKYDWIIQTKPSVIVYPNDWISSFADKIENNINLVVGYSNIASKKGLMNLLYKVELFFQQFQSFAFIGCGCGYVVEEDNIALLRQKYFEMGGFAGEMDDAYMNLERLINKVIKRKYTALNLSSEGVIHKNRFINAKKYKDLVIKSIHIKRKLKFLIRTVLLIDKLSKLFLVPLSIIAIFLFPEIILTSSIIILSKVILHMFIIYQVLNSLNEKKLFISSLIYEQIIPYYKLIYIRNYFSSLRKRKWNNN
ncbi:MAG: glycosyltransferase [Mariniphaga sp.]|nr:glycosyltransferase [Mariniphaga sp.]